MRAWAQGDTAFHEAHAAQSRHPIRSHETSSEHVALDRLAVTAQSHAMDFGAEETLCQDPPSQDIDVNVRVSPSKKASLSFPELNCGQNLETKAKSNVDGGALEDREPLVDSSMDWSASAVYERQASMKTDPTGSIGWVDYILAADVVWLDELIPALVETMVSLAALPTAQPQRQPVVINYGQRVCA